MVTRRQLRGAEVFAGQLGRGLAGRGHTVALVSLYAPGEPPLTPADVEIVDLGGRRGRDFSPALLRAHAAFLRRWRPDVVQANGSDTYKYLVLARRLARLRTPLVYRNISIASAWLRGPAHRAWNRWLARQADAIAAVSLASAADYAEVYGLPPERIWTIPVGTPVPERVDREEARRRLASILGGDPPGPFVLHVGSFTPEKDHAVLLEAFARVNRRHPEARLVLAGDGPLRQEIANRVGAIGLGERVQLVGARDDLQEWMAGADLLVLSSRIEGLPGVVLEGAVRRLPVVATDVGSVSDAVVDGTTGLLVPSADSDALAAALDRLLADSGLRERMGTEGREHIRRCFSLDGVVARFEALYRELVGGDRG